MFHGDFYAEAVVSDFKGQAPVFRIIRINDKGDGRIQGQGLGLADYCVEIEFFLYILDDLSHDLVGDLSNGIGHLRG